MSATPATQPAKAGMGCLTSRTAERIDRAGAGVPVRQDHVWTKALGSMTEAADRDQVAIGVTGMLFGVCSPGRCRRGERSKQTAAEQTALQQESATGAEQVHDVPSLRGSLL